MVKKETERRYLLKRNPCAWGELIYDDMIHIDQHYSTDGKNIRYRKCVDKDLKKTYFATIKKSISKMTATEDEREITEEEFNYNVHSDMKSIKKVRYVVKVNNLKWEIDTFISADLVIAEIELPNEKHKVPHILDIQRNIIIEVTNKKEFSNYNLAQ